MRRGILTLLLVLAATAVHAESITYRIVEYNADAGDFVLAAHGMRPVGSYAIFENEFGATRGNRYNQIPRNKQATLWLEGWEGCTINSVTLAMCSNNTSGTAGLVVTAGEKELYNMRPLPFDDPEWFGHWLSKDLQTYGEVTKPMTTLSPIGNTDEVAITVKGGTPEGSVYLDAVTIDYTPANWVKTESPLGWAYEKLEAKSTLADGDVIMLYRSGFAAGDIDGMEQTHYLDAIGLASTSNVTEPFVLTFTAHKTNDGHWTLVSQYGEYLAAAGAQDLRWDAGIVTWDITLGYNGATIASSLPSCGTLRYNAPAGSYPRFWNYTSTSLPLPYIYRRSHQLQPIQCQSLVIQHPSAGYDGPISVDLAQQHTILLLPEFHPSNVTSRRLVWESSAPEVASVRSGVVFLHAPGRATISATCRDWTPDETEDGAMACIPPTAYIDIIVEDTAAGIATPQIHAVTHSLFDEQGRRLIAPPLRGIYIDSGFIRVR